MVAGGVNVVVEGFPVPVTPANSTDSCNSEPIDEPHAVDTVRMTVSSLLPRITHQYPDAPISGHLYLLNGRSSGLCFYTIR